MSIYIGKTISYPKFVEVEKIVSQEDSNFRFCLDIPFVGCNNKGKLVIILKNPSSASAKNCDVTISKICNVAHNNDYSGAIVMNLFPIRATHAVDVQNFYGNENYDKIMHDNLINIIKQCENRDVVFAWGKDSIGGHKTYPRKYIDAILNITKSILKNIYYVDRCSCDNNNCACQGCNYKNKVFYPLHGLRWSNKSKLYPL